MKKYLVYILILLPWLQLSALGQENTENLSCLDCHEPIISEQVVHAPATESCVDCHTPTGNKHPNEQQKGFTLSESLPELCFICHDTYNEGTVHAPIEAGECVICHSPHSSSNDHLLVTQTDKLCFECHDPEMMEKRIIHQPLHQGNCQACHNPHNSNESSLLNTGMPDLCFHCHENIAQQITEEFIHPPFEDDCMNCHSPHSSDERQLINLPGNGICFECHDDIRESIENSHVFHKIINDVGGCAQCHSAHASPHSKYLVDKPTELCLNCHNKIITTSTRKLSNIRRKLDQDHFVHRAIEFDGCAGCHTAHFSEFPSLLTDAYPEGNYSEGKPARFALCFNCHDKEIIEVEKSMSISNFRNGNLNLHFLHIHGDKARNCGTCHDMHGSMNDHLIAEEVVFGNWIMPVRFKVNLNGGSCFTGCHGEKKYDRINAVDNSLNKEQTPLKKIDKYVTMDKVTHGDSVASQKLVASTFNLEFKQLEEEFNHLQIPPIYFYSRKTTMVEGSEGILRMIIDFLNDHPESNILLEGHADKFSEKVYDHALSQKRADRIKSIILSFGIENDRIETIGYGISKPATGDHNKKSRQLNRRVEVRLLKK